MRRVEGFFSRKPLDGGAPTGAGVPAMPPAEATPHAPPSSPVSFRPPAPDELMRLAKEFDDGAATVLVPRTAAPPVPADLFPTPNLTHEGERFGLGYLEDSFGIWYLHQKRAPVELFARTAEGWNSAWKSFVKLEPKYAKQKRTT